MLIFEVGGVSREHPVTAEQKIMPLKSLVVVGIWFSETKKSSISNLPQNNEIARILRANKVDSNSAWIGLDRLRGSWTLSDGSQLCWAGNWMLGRPKTSRKCVSMNSDGTWKEGWCYNFRSYFCQIGL